MGLELGEGVFDRVEVGTVGRQVKQGGAARFDDIPDTGDLMGRQIVHDDDIAWPQGRSQHLLAPGEEDFAIHRLVDEHRRDHAGKGQSADEGDGLPMSVRDRGAAASSFRGPPPKPCHLCR
jgi:hypothetical protein